MSAETKTSPEQTPVVSEEEYAKKLHIGSVDYNATEDELTKYFDKFKVEKVEIPTVIIKSGEKRSAGYAFVDLVSKDDVASFIETYHKTVFHERSLSVKKALPPAEKEKLVKAKRDAKKAALKAKKEASAAAADSKSSKKAAAPKKELKKAVKSEEKASADKEKTSKPKEAAKKPFQPKPKVSLTDGVESKTTVYITNIDFNLNSTHLSDYLKNETEYNPVWVNVPVRRLPKRLYDTLKRNNALIKYKTKGFGFVKFATEEEQKRFIKEFDGKKINDRDISVKAATETPESKKLEEAQEAQGKQDAAVETATTA